MRSLVVALGLVLAACGGGVAGPSPSASPPPSAGAAVTITRADDGRTVAARVGDTIQVALGTEYEWRLDPPDGVVLVPDARRLLLVRGTQALLHAAAPGRSVVQATGTIICPSGRACPQLAVLFRTTVVVGP